MYNKRSSSEVYQSRCLLSFSIFCLFMTLVAPLWKKGSEIRSLNKASESCRKSENPNSSTWMDSLLLESVGKSYFLDQLTGLLLCLTILRCGSAQPSPTLFPFSFLCADIFILLLKLLRAHYLRGRNVALIVWWLHR